MDRRRGAVGTQQMMRARTEPCPATKGRPGADRLSALSDELLLRILSFLGIRTAISTCCLSRRWRYLYHYLSSLDFSVGWDQDSACFIDRVLLLHAAPRIEIFRFSIRVEAGRGSFACDRQIDTWLLFAVRRGVRVLDLDIQDDDLYDYGFSEGNYNLPSWVFHCRTLEDFSVENCRLCQPGHIRLVSLKKMRLSLTKLGDDDLKRLLLGCPLLQSLELEHCNEESDLVIDARGSQRLEELVIIDGIDYDNPTHYTTEMQIDAPSVQYLRFHGVSFRRKYEVRDLSSLDVASFDLDEIRFFYEAEADVFTTGFLLRIPQVRVLKLCTWSLQALSLREPEGDLVSAFPGVTTLELKIGWEESELLAIPNALRACNKLRTLILRKTMAVDSIKRKFDNSHSDEKEGTRLLSPNSDIVMRDLKTIMIQGLTRYTQGLGERGSEGADFVAHKGENDIVLIGFLLKVSPVLEKLIVQPSKGMYKMARKWELLFNLSSVLLSLPRASPNAKVIIDGK